MGSFGQGKIIDMSGGGFISSNDENICTKIEKKL